MKLEFSCTGRFVHSASWT